MEKNADVEIQEEIKPVEIEKYDNTQHLGKKAKIEKISKHMTDKFNKKSYYIKVVTEKLDTLDNEDKTEIRASKIFSLQKDKEGKLGWSENSKLARFMKSIGASTEQEIVGKEVTILLTEPNEHGQRFCTF
jgi:hypothetical protein